MIALPRGSLSFGRYKKACLVMFAMRTFVFIPNSVGERSAMCQQPDLTRCGKIRITGPRGNNLPAPARTQKSPARRAAKKSDDRLAAAAPRKADQFVQSFAKGLSVIRAFGTQTRTLTLSQVSALTGLSRAAARRILLTLQTLRYVQPEGRNFSLTPKILDLGYSYLSTTPLWNVAEPFMEEVVNTVHESCSASVLDGTDIVYILRVPTKKIMAINLSIGSRLPAFCTSMGRILLGDLSDDALNAVLTQSRLKPYSPRTETNLSRLKKIIREDHQKGWSLVDQELEEGLVSLSVPIRDRNGKIIAAMNVSGQATRTPPKEMIKTFLPVLKRSAEQINTALRMRQV
jgi:IclR family transcriptional regulator, pca regulon regulatory protein